MSFKSGKRVAIKQTFHLLSRIPQDEPMDYFPAIRAGFSFSDTRDHRYLRITSLLSIDVKPERFRLRVAKPVGVTWKNSS